MKRFREIEVKPKRDERVIIYCNINTKKRWQKTVIDMNVTNYEDAISKLLELYELSSKYLKEKDISKLIKKLNEVLGISIKMNIVF